MATRMMQSLPVSTIGDAKAEREREIQNRTFWGCFIMDRLVSCGRSQPLCLPLEKMTIHLPIGEQDFAFGKPTAPRLTYKDLQELLLSSAPPDTQGTINNYYSVLIRGFDIWARVLEFIVSGGRRQPHMAALENCPWVINSPWKAIYDSLEDWRAQQSDRLHYPGSSIATHVSLGRGESFAFINLVYYVRYVICCSSLVIVSDIW